MYCSCVPYLTREYWHQQPPPEEETNPLLTNTQEEEILSFQYGELPGGKGQFRLIILSPALKIEAPLKAHVLHSSLDERPIYNALSYTWGDPNFTFEIYLDDCIFWITENLDAALRQLRHNSESRTLWVDAICINQRNTTERNQQVTQMRKIYEQSERVDVWLGPGTESSSNTLRLLESIAVIVREQELGLGISQPPTAEVTQIVQPIAASQLKDLSVDARWLEDVKDVLNRQWWSRVWIQQELGVASQAAFLCGTSTINWLDFSLGMHFLKYLMLAGEGQFAQNPSFLKAFLGPGITLDLRQEWNKKRFSLLDVVSTHGSLKFGNASDPRDRVFALLGVAEDDLGIRPDYNLSTAEVYCVLVKAQIQSVNIKDSRRLSILSFSQEKTFKRIENIASWAPDWSAYMDTCIASTSLSMDAVYYAGGNIFDGMPVSRDGDWGCLRVLGTTIGTINHLGPNCRITPEQQYPSKQLVELYLSCMYLISALSVFAENLSRDPSDREGDINSTMWRILIHDKAFFQGLTLVEERAPHSNAHIFKVMLGEEEPPEDLLPTEIDVIRRGRYSEQYMRAMESRGHFRRSFWSNRGYLVIASHFVEEGDILCVLGGAEVPFVLRKVNSHYILMGEAYVDGIMDGEAMEGKKREDLEIFELR